MMINIAAGWLVNFLLFVFISYLIIGILMRFLNRRTLKHCQSRAFLDGKVIIITGASSGIGKEAAKDFAKRRATVIFACRNIEKAQKVVDEIIASTGNSKVEVLHLDTSSLTSVRSFAKRINERESRLDVLILNAGRSGPPAYTLTDDDLEITMATNHFGHFLLADLLLDLLKKSSPSRIIVTSSRAHLLLRKINPSDLNFKNSKYNRSSAYQLSKLCNIFFTKYLAYQLNNWGVTVNCFCPGLVDTNIFLKHSFMGVVTDIFAPIGYRTPEEGSQTLIHLAVSEDASNISGAFFYDCQVRKSSDLSEDAGLIKKVWEKSEELVSLDRLQETN